MCVLASVSLYICTYVCMYICLWVYVHAWIMCVHMHTCICLLCICLISLCLHVYICVNIYVCMCLLCVCMYVSMYVFVCQCLCMCISLCCCVCACVCCIYLHWIRLWQREYAHGDQAGSYQNPSSACPHWLRSTVPCWPTIFLLAEIQGKTWLWKWIDQTRPPVLYANQKMILFW